MGRLFGFKMASKGTGDIKRYGNLEQGTKKRRKRATEGKNLTLFEESE